MTISPSRTGKVITSGFSEDAKIRNKYFATFWRKPMPSFMEDIIISWVEK